MVWGTLVAALLASCVDTEIADVTGTKPESIAQYEYLNDYAPLKSYIDRAANPDFKLGLALAANEFCEGGLVFRLAEANFDEVTAGNAMKYASCVNDKGEMDFETVDKFVTAAQAAGITIYGHTLAWHAQQNNKYLNSLIKDKELPPAVGEGNGDAQGSETTNFVSTHVGGANAACDIVDGVGKDGSRAFVVTSAGGGTNSWDTQFFLYADRPLVENDVVRISFDYRADTPNNSESQAHAAPGAYIHYDGGCAVSFTTEWQHFEKTITINTTLSPEGNMQTFAWNLDVGAPNAPANKYYFDNIKLQIVTKGNTIPLTPEEKKEALTRAMNNWIEGMMKATGGYVTTWDVVNEAISGDGNDGEGFYVLQSASNEDADPVNNFYWQDYLGSEDYVRIVVAAARKYYAENGGVKPLKLFINDYNLESTWDDNKKAKSLVHWIEKWESDGVTKIDGIGTQMHVTYNADAAKQQKQEEHVVKMFEILAKSGKLVKVSELDMGYVDESGTVVLTKDMTEEQHKAMAEYYKFIVKKYFEIIPVAQQYGITQWCATDAPGAPGDSNWRGGEPVGLWDSNYNRKHTYAGFADGLAGK